jgi:hypothetical protein
MGSRSISAGLVTAILVLASTRVEAPRAAFAAGPIAGLARQGSEPDFAKEILPLLEARCLGCHGLQQQMSGLRLDSRESALKGGKSGPAIVPGKGAESLLYRKVTGAAEGSPMPLSGEKLTAPQLEAIRSWIDRGATWTAALTEARAAKKHWAYVPPARPTLPEVKERSWVRNPIDAFVLERLEREGLKPSPEASKETLIRRVSLDLVGLPPSPREVEDFLADARPDAYERVVDRLLASPRYGERWARPWLDLARYADTGGYIHDRPRSMWPYRDWVIRALNADLPFDRFTIEQIAGDLLPNATMDQKIATGFHRNTMINTEGGVDPEEYRVAAILDRVDTTATVWLGSTLGCAQCHDHKFNPFTQEEYYRFFAFFNGTEEENNPAKKINAASASLRLPPPEYLAASRVEAEDEILRLEAALSTSTPQLDQSRARWERETRPALPRWVPLDAVTFGSAAGATLTKLEDRSILAGGRNPERDTYVVVANVDLRGISGIRLEALTHPGLPVGGASRGADGNFVLTQFEVAATSGRDPGPPKRVKLSAAVADYEQKGFEVAKSIDDNPATGWSVEGSREELRVDRQATFAFEHPLDFDGGAQLTIRLRHDSDRPNSAIGRFRLSVTTAPTPTKPKLPLQVERILALEPDRRTAEQQARLAQYHRSIAAELDPLRTRLEQLRQSWDQATTPSTLVMREMGESRKSHVFMRGSFLNRGKEVTPGVPSALHPLEAGQPVNRLALAKWLVAPENPLVGRVTVNRIWMEHFGHALVATPDDFGTQGAAPTHPALLDWLATELVRQGWSVKKIHRLIATSATYRQSSRTPATLRERDPDNELYARGGRFRMDAEMIRDNALAIAGLLSPKMYGPSVFPPQPEGLLEVLYVPDNWTTSTGEDRYRRGLYTFWKRILTYPSFTIFDAPSRETACVRRIRTNTPLQALDLLNDPVFLEAAQGLARRVIAEGGADARSRIGYGFRLCTGRRPQPAELEEMARLFADQRKYFGEHPEAGRGAASSETRLPAGMGEAEAAAWVAVSHALLNLDETITRP